MTSIRRRQKHSCDQCRHGKRACDAGDSSRVEFSQRVCKNCQRTNKHCTFEWVNSLETKGSQDRKRRRVVESPHSSNAASSPSLSQSQNDGPLAGIDSEAFKKHAHSWVVPLMSSSDLFSQQDCSDSPILSYNSWEIGDASDEYGMANTSSSGNAESLSQPLEDSDRRQGKSTKSDRSHHTTLFPKPGEITTWPSPSSNWGLGETTSRRFMTNGLLRIYHDSMENALSCWLTEHNCPYTMIRRGRNPSLVEPRHIATEWGLMWSNRMHTRVCHLDRAYMVVRSRPLTIREEQMTSRALRLAILAFASQWAQAGDRATSSLRASAATFGSLEETFPQSDMFGRSMQESLWHQASRLLHEAAGIESFRVVFALIIFSLTQRPIDTKQSQLFNRASPSGFRDLQRIIEGENAPLFLEMALRQIYSFRRKLECFEREHSSTQSGRKQSPLQQEHRETFNLLYWLGVMFDTLSAAMCHRPLVVEDEDSDLPPSSSDESSHTSHEKHMQRTDWIEYDNIEDLQPPNELWGDRFMSTESSNSQPTRWPCSYELAASTLSSAAPVKVLLFRRVARLQTLLSRKASATSLESAIKDTFNVYDHWNCVYNPFISDCVAHHDELPARIQSWYILLAGHWHLATFLLSDVISTIDTSSLSLPIERQARQTSRLVPKLQRENAFAVANLSRASLHGSLDRSFQNAREFHFAVNKAALLTEPWTVVLIRSLSRAGYILAELASRDVPASESMEVGSRCGDCVEALWFLGRKSDMAFLAARFLSNMLRENPRRSSLVQTTEPSLLGREYSGSNGSSYSSNSHTYASSSDFTSIDDTSALFSDIFSSDNDLLSNPELEPWPVFEENESLESGATQNYSIPPMATDTIPTHGMFENVSICDNFPPLFA